MISNNILFILVMQRELNTLNERLITSYALKWILLTRKKNLLLFSDPTDIFHACQPSAFPVTFFSLVVWGCSPDSSPCAGKAVIFNWSYNPARSWGYKVGVERWAPSRCRCSAGRERI